MGIAGSGMVPYILFLADGWLLAILCVLGMIRRTHRDVALDTWFLLGCVLIWNPILKEWWGVPLLPSVGKPGFAFPSGHMHTAAIVYGWWVWQGVGRYTAWAALAGGLSLLGWAMVVQGYHTWTEIAGAWVAAAMMAVGYRFLQRRYTDPRDARWCLLVVANLGVAYMGLFGLTYPSPFPYLALAGITVAYAVTQIKGASRQPLAAPLVQAARCKRVCGTCP